MLGKYFETIYDSRQTGKIKHNMLEVITMTICAVVSGCEHWEEIEDFSALKFLDIGRKASLKLKRKAVSWRPVLFLEQALSL